MGAFQILVRRRRAGWALDRGEIFSRFVATDPPDVALVSILKPLANLDDDLEANLESFASLEGHRYEVLFGVASLSDPATLAARRFIDRHPEVEARLVLTHPHAASNPKVAQLIGLAAEARGNVFVITDSNVRVRSDYLVSMLEPLGDRRCGLVTSLFAGTGERTSSAALENLHLAAVIAPSVVLSTLHVPVTVGKSMAFRRDALEAIGGFAAFGGYLAEDAMMGRRFVDAGHRVATVFTPVENRNVIGALSRTFERHTRWAKMRRVLCAPFYASEPFFSPLVIATLALLVSPGRATLLGVVAAAFLQTVTAMAAVRTVRGRWLAWRYLPLEIVRAFVLFACWIVAWTNRSVVWRGNPRTIGPETRLVPTTVPTVAVPTPAVPTTVAVPATATALGSRSRRRVRSVKTSRLAA